MSTEGHCHQFNANWGAVQRETVFSKNSSVVKQLGLALEQPRYSTETEGRFACIERILPTPSPIGPFLCK